MNNNNNSSSNNANNNRNFNYILEAEIMKIKPGNTLSSININNCIQFFSKFCDQYQLSKPEILGNFCIELTQLLDSSLIEDLVPEKNKLAVFFHFIEK